MENSSVTLAKQKEVLPICYKAGDFSTISEELLWHIFSSLGVDDLRHASQVNQQWHRVAEDNVLWKKLSLTTEWQ